VPEPKRPGEIDREEKAADQDADEGEIIAIADEG
jgi:hypothetical protein